MTDLSIYATVNLSARGLRENLGGEFTPAKFYGLDTSGFGSSRKNPFFKLKAIAMDPANPIDDRMRATRYMDRIPHVYHLPNTIEAAISIIDDDSAPIGERYFFMSNHEKQCKLSDHVVRACHLHFFTSTKDKISTPLILRLLSAQFVYTTFGPSQPEWINVRDFIVNLALDVNETVRIRSEAADILCRRINKIDHAIGLKVIQELGELYSKNKMTSIYTNAQNAHNESITESVMNVIRALLAARSTKAAKVENVETFTGDAMSIKGDQNTGDIYERIMKLVERVDVPRRDKIMAAFNFILIYPGKYEGITLSDILCLVWNKIYDQEPEIKIELEQRLLQELFEMDESCGTGLCGRLINVLSGYVHEEGMQVKMSYRDQLRANVFARLQAQMRVRPEKDQDTILEEIADDESKKETAREFVDSYSVEDELKAEFVTSKLITMGEFDDIYEVCIRDFLGIPQPELKKV